MFHHVHEILVSCDVVRVAAATFSRPPSKPHPPRTTRRTARQHTHLASHSPRTPRHRYPQPTNRTSCPIRSFLHASTHTGAKHRTPHTHYPLYESDTKTSNHLPNLTAPTRTTNWQRHAHFYERATFFMGLKRCLVLDDLEADAKRQREAENFVVNQATADGGECKICRSLLIQKCNQCSAAGTAVGFTCVLSFGACGCVFHHHCVGHWLYKSYVCPVHETTWQPSAARPFCCEVASDRR